jgi:hypothetical protein
VIITNVGATTNVDTTSGTVGHNSSSWAATSIGTARKPPARFVYRMILEQRLPNCSPAWQKLSRALRLKGLSQR